MKLHASGTGVFVFRSPLRYARQQTWKESSMDRCVVSFRRDVHLSATDKLAQLAIDFLPFVHPGNRQKVLLACLAKFAV